MKNTNDSVKVQGMFRVNITENGKVVGDSGWRKNQITNLGFNQYLVGSLGNISGKAVTHAALGTGGAPAAADTTLAGEQSVRAALTVATSSSSKTLRNTATFSSAASFVTASKNISNIGLFNTSTAATGTLFAGNTYASSTVATNQDVNVTYDIIFA
jgi:NADPH-dependent glutamate synthase beta subunit-like oxidoreductase